MLKYLIVSYVIKNVLKHVNIINNVQINLYAILHLVDQINNKMSNTYENYLLFLDI